MIIIIIILCRIDEEEDILLFRNRSYTTSILYSRIICYKLNTNAVHHMIILAVNINNIEEVLESELGISKQEAKLFVLIVYKGRMTLEMISKVLHWSMDDATSVAKSLVDRGMIIDITKTEYESLHPRFAVTNQYRKRCHEKHLIFKKNIKVDNIGMILESYYNNARIK